MHRRRLIPEIRAGRKTWHDYSLLCADDEPIEGAVALLRLLENQAWNIAVSGSSVLALGITRDWARRHDVPLDDFLMRPDDTPNGEWKVAAVRRLRDAGLTVRLFVEDWAPAAREIREQTGVPVLGVNPFDPDTCLVGRAQLAMELAAHPAYSNAAWVEPEELAADIFSRLVGEHA
jgi:hypothetical protein